MTKSFDAKKRCTHRTYSYYCPTICFGPKENWDNPNENARQFRIEQSQLDFLGELLQNYKGTKSYHNFTSGKQKGKIIQEADNHTQGGRGPYYFCFKFNFLKGEEAAKRHILSFEIFGEAFICSGWEYIELRVKGQSFMIHQIRKMIGLMIARCSGHCNDDHIQRAFEHNFEDIPKVRNLVQSCVNWQIRGFSAFNRVGKSCEFTVGNDCI